MPIGFDEMVEKLRVLRSKAEGKSNGKRAFQLIAALRQVGILKKS
jgi:hypothetical protein